VPGLPCGRRRKQVRNDAGVLAPCDAETWAVMRMRCWLTERSSARLLDIFSLTGPQEVHGGGPFQDDIIRGGIPGYGVTG